MKIKNLFFAFFLYGMMFSIGWSSGSERELDFSEIIKNHRNFVNQALMDVVSVSDFENQLLEDSNAVIAFEASQAIEDTIITKVRNLLIRNFRETLFLGSAVSNAEIPSLQYRDDALESALWDFARLSAAAKKKELTINKASNYQEFIEEFIAYQTTRFAGESSEAISLEEVYLFVNREFVFEIIYSGQVESSLMMKFQQPKFRRVLDTFGILI
ncbi:MAG: hypothetical protein ACQKBT_00210 [Puniceicoccales bacterium]